MRAYKRWDVSGTQARVSVVGKPEHAAVSVVCHEIPDGTSIILDPVALLVEHPDGHTEHVAIHDIAAADDQAEPGECDA